MSKNNIRPIKILQDEEGKIVTPKKKVALKFKLLGFCFLLILVGIIWSFFSSSSSVFNYVFSQGENLKTTDGRVNVLLLGVVGGTQDGAILTDSNTVASYNVKTQQAILISVPRDLWIDSIHEKVNAAYEVGQLDKNGNNGLKFAEDKIDDILGIPIHYGVKLDFSGFNKAMDQVGGVDIEVPRTFDDYNYPKEGAENDSCGLTEKEVELDATNAAILHMQPGKRKVWVRGDDKVATEAADFGCRFEHIHFDKGVMHMDGTTALKFVRSRMGTNGEGSDFARSRRQQLVIEAFRKKALSLDTLSNPSKIGGLISAFGTSFETDIPAGKYLEFYNMVKNMQETKNIVLGDLGNGQSVLVNPSSGDYGGAWGLFPPNNEFIPIKGFIKKQLYCNETTSKERKKYKLKFMET